MSYRRDINKAAPGVDGMLELGLQGVAAAVLIVAAVFWAVTAFSMFVFFGIKNGFAKTTQHVWEATAQPRPKNPPNQTI